MSALNPTITKWEDQGLKWIYVLNPAYRTFQVPAKGQVQLPYKDFIYNAPEGVLHFFTAGFDSPTCGIRMVWDPEFDSGESFTVGNVSISLSNIVDPLVYAIIPPQAPTGWYIIRVASQWKWENNLRLYVINTDSSAHYCLGFAYMVSMLTDEKPSLSNLDLAEVQTLAQLYPRQRTELSEILRYYANESLRRIRRKVG